MVEKITTSKQSQQRGPKIDVIQVPVGLLLQEQHLQSYQEAGEESQLRPHDNSPGQT